MKWSLFLLVSLMHVFIWNMGKDAVNLNGEYEFLYIVEWKCLYKHNVCVTVKFLAAN